MPKIALILDNVRSAHNVGSIMRSADGFGVSHIYFAGYTPYPGMVDDTRLPHEINKLTGAIHKTALGAEKTVPFSVYKNINSALKAAKDAGYSLACLEQSPGSVTLSAYNNQTDIAVILGNEVTGIDKDILSQADVVLEIPMNGKKESLNVSISAAICLYALKNPCNQTL